MPQKYPSLYNGVRFLPGDLYISTRAKEQYYSVGTPQPHNKTRATNKIFMAFY